MITKNPKRFNYLKKIKRLPTFSGRPASQNPYEFLTLIEILKEEGVESYLEIGARHGDSFYEIVKNALSKDSIAVAVDLPGASWGNVKSKTALEKVINKLKVLGYKNVSYLFGDSTTEATRNLINKRRNGKPYDAIFIDGDHTYDGVKKDFDNYSKYGNIIIFHDIAGVGQRDIKRNLDVEVPKFWNDLKERYGEQYRMIELIDDDSKFGIGILCLNTNK